MHWDRADISGEEISIEEAKPFKFGNYGGAHSEAPKKADFVSFR